MAKQATIKLPPEVYEELENASMVLGIDEQKIVQTFFQLGFLALKEQLYIKQDGEIAELEVFKGWWNGPKNE